MDAGDESEGLAEFLLARIAEDRSALREFDGQLVGHVPSDADLERGYYLISDATEADLIAVNPWRLFLECQTKSQIVHDYQRARDLARRPRGPVDDNVAVWLSALENVLKEMANAYLGHPDYRDEWSRAVPIHVTGDPFAARSKAR